MLQPIEEIAKKIGIKEDELIPYGRYKAKVKLDILKRLKGRKNGKLILITTINPTFEGEGKTTITIGLAQALSKLGKKACLAIREPSIAPLMGAKGGGTGGGKSKVEPSQDINMHFTGDKYAVSIAHNLLSSLIDNHIFYGNSFGIDPRYILWPRVIDIGDRSLRNVVIGLGGAKDGVPREEKFSITAASEIMAILCLSESIKEIKERIGKIIVAYSRENEPIRAEKFNAVGAMCALLKDAIMPNLVQTTENIPAFVHGGPFANIAHGASSLIATRMGLKLADYFVTEAGFGTDLGAEKFFDIVCRNNLKPDIAVIVVSLKSLKWHGGMDIEDAKRKENINAVKKGLENLEKHIENIQTFGLPMVVALNKFENDSEKEIRVVEKFCEEKGVPFAVAEVYEEGGEGGIELAGKVIDTIYNNKPKFRFLYENDFSVKEKIEIISGKIYGAEKVVYTLPAEDEIRRINKIGLNCLPVCIAKTPYSLSDDPSLRGRPKNFKITVKEIRISAGAGFLVPITGKITTMPGLPMKPSAENIDVDEGGNIIGV
ncbi:MAG: formate--tetrahydrofolate ligase [Thermoplasmatales archaeon]|nr:formate--tetrahydrofolate ligase [Thermoplasmatales archaeon]